MSYEMSALDLHFLVREMGFLKDARVEKIYNPQKKELILLLFVSGLGKKILRITAPGYMYATDFKDEQPERPSGFCTMLRKYLDSTRLRAVGQMGFERIIEFQFEGKEENFRLIFELFSKGNIIFCRDDYTIIAPVENQEWRERTIRPKLKYTYPKKPCNVLAVGADELRELASKSGKSIVKLLAVDLGLGGVYSEELCQRSGVSKEKTELGDADIRSLITAKDKMLDAPIEAGIYMDAGKIKAISPITLESLQGLERAKFGTYNEALDYAFTNDLIVQVDSKRLSRHQAKLEKLQKIIDRQEEYIKELEKDAIEDSRKGEMIYSNYQMLTDVLAELSKARKKFSLKEMKEKLKGHKVVVDIKEKEKIAVVEL